MYFTLTHKLTCMYMYTLAYIYIYICTYLHIYAAYMHVSGEA